MTTDETNTRLIVLVVEDEPLLRMTAVDMVEEAGFTALEAADATEAIRILESRFDIRIVFTDIDMPRGIDGIRLAAVIRHRWPPIDIIVTSGHVDAGEVDLPARCKFLPKPYDERLVIAAMRSFAA
ncbi:response regulator [Rhodopseudomonas palustris]|uniref:response regulator n=1 Tax=Rhodopseudomonas palustris TaxID=1076 RepID=UPI000E5B6B6B|nr:response regulator [Rhodopseudomonas palustris]QLH73009.1 response regulator [Rhodopseudomonas palustris]RIA02407.1 response regulator [Rhodopseudomonas palustris]